MRILGADVGGTNTRVALSDDDTLQPRDVRRFLNADFDSLSAVLRHYLADVGSPGCDAACVAIAGPVRQGRGRLTNLNWSMDAARLAEATGARRAFVINDLEAQGHALPHVETRHIHGGDVRPADGARLVVGLGTGFNAAPVHRPDGGDGAVSVFPSECGHISLPVWDDQSLAIAKALQQAHGFASVEEVLSGRGLLALHRHVAAPGDHLGSTAEIIAAIRDARRPSDTQTARLFCGILGRVLGDLALIHLPWAGLYLIGGLARAVTPFFADHGFAEAFADKGRFSELVSEFGVYLVDDDFSALIGCAEYAAQAVNRGPRFEA